MQELTAKAKEFFNLVTEWFTSNKLILNKDKTNVLLFKTKQSNIIKPSQIELNNKELNLMENAKFLGIYINENLNWSFHINKLIKKLNSICYGIRIVGTYMNEKSLKILYYANFESVLKYGIIFWGRDSMTQNIFVIQKRLIRIIKKMSYLQSCRSVFKSLGIMTIFAVYIYECLMFFFRNKNLFDLKPKHEYRTRTLDINYIKHRLTLTEKSPHYMCIKLFNSLPGRLKCITSPKKFKLELRKLLIDLEPYNLKEFCPDL